MQDAKEKIARDLSALEALAAANNNARLKAFGAEYSSLPPTDPERREFEQEWDAERGQHFKDKRRLKQALVSSKVHAVKDNLNFS